MAVNTSDEYLDELLQSIEPIINPESLRTETEVTTPVQQETNEDVVMTEMEIGAEVELMPEMEIGAEVELMPEMEIGTGVESITGGMQPRRRSGLHRGGTAGWMQELRELHGPRRSCAGYPSCQHR